MKKKKKTSVFLTAEWRKLAFANYEIDPALLKHWLPAGTEIDLWKGKCYVSLVGFLFLNTRLKGIPVPFHRNFEEVNLRFYVRRMHDGEYRRGVVFIREIVPKPALCLVANSVYREKYVAMPMRHEWSEDSSSLHVVYRWKDKSWHQMVLTTEKEPIVIREGSKEQFITEHYWGYSPLDRQRTREYAVEHPSWNMYPVKEYEIQADFGTLYGPEFSFLSQAKPDSVMLAEGSPVIVRSASQI